MNTSSGKDKIPMSPGEHLEKVERIDALIRERRAAARHFPSQRVLELQAQLAKGSRDMFLEHLANALDGQASLSEIRALSSEDPLKGAQVLQIYSKLAGVAERSEVAIDPNKIPMSEAIALLREFGFTVPEKLFPHEIESSVASSAPSQRTSGGQPAAVVVDKGTISHEGTTKGTMGGMEPGSRSEALLSGGLSAGASTMAASSLRKDAERGAATPGSKRGSAAELHPDMALRPSRSFTSGEQAGAAAMASSTAALRAESDDDV